MTAAASSSCSLWVRALALARSARTTMGGAAEATCLLRAARGSAERGQRARVPRIEFQRGLEVARRFGAVRIERLQEHAELAEKVGALDMGQGHGEVDVRHRHAGTERNAERTTVGMDGAIELGD